MDVKRVEGGYRVFARGGRDDTGRDAREWVRRGEALGAGEIVLNSIDTDGVRGGFDLPMLEAVGRVVSVLIVASGGAGTMQDFAEAFRIPGVGAGLSAGAFHSKTVPFVGYLGRNMVDAVAVGEIFSSPPAQAFYDAFLAAEDRKSTRCTPVTVASRMPSSA